VLNGATYTNNSNSFSINGININATKTTTSVTQDAAGNTVETDDPVVITTSVDTQGMYDKIKKMFSEFNEMITYLDTLYYADSASGYEPLTSDEKEAMTDKQIEEWENKIKTALLRKDSTLSGFTSAMKNALIGTKVLLTELIILYHHSVSEPRVILPQKMRQGIISISMVIRMMRFPHQTVINLWRPFHPILIR